MSFFLGIDLGTSYFKAGVFDEQGRLKGLGRCAVNKEAGDGDFCELPVPAFREILRTCVGHAVENSGISPREIKAVSYSSQANSFVLLDKTDEPLTPLVLWPDERVKRLPDSFQTLIGRPDFQEKTGLGISPGIQSLAAKVHWYSINRSRIWEQVKSILSISDYFTFMLTGEKVSDGSTASMTGLFDVRGHRWWNDALEMLEIEQRYLPLPVNTGTFVGTLTGKGAEWIGLSPGTSFFAGALDHHMAAVGAGLQRLKNVSESTGTVLACVNYRQGYKPGKGINIAPGPENDHYFQMAFDENGAASLEWYQKKYVPGLSMATLLEMAEDIEPGSDGLTAKPNVNKFAKLQGFSNVKEFHTPAHFVRAILESTALSLSKLTKDLNVPDLVTSIIPTGGGAQSLLWLQIKADMLNKTFLVPECNELACQGTAMMAFMGNDFPQNMNDTIKTWVRFKKTITPNHENVEKYKRLKQSYRKIKS